MITRSLKAEEILIGKMLKMDRSSNNDIFKKYLSIIDGMVTLALIAK